ncbi:hypothetical protein KJ865_11005, partial [Myxococcota bacterium]|nr:hypothetical protein [Myxococcota bacterium]
IAVNADCTHVAAGSTGMTVGVVATTKGKAWKRSDVRNVCAGPSCHEGARVGFIQGNRWLMAAINGDTIRKFSLKSGRLAPFRGGFGGRIQDFVVSPHYVAALYKHGLAVWRTTVGLISKKKQPGMVRLFGGPRVLLLASKQSLTLVSRGGKTMATALVDSLPMDARPVKKGWAVLFAKKVVLYSATLKKTASMPLLPNHRGILLVPSKAAFPGVITASGSDLSLLTHDKNQFAGVALKGVPTFKSGTTRLAAGSKCIALSQDKGLWFVTVTP